MPRPWVDFKRIKAEARFEPILERYGLKLERGQGRSSLLVAARCLRRGPAPLIVTLGTVSALPNVDEPARSRID